jgi:hypothetical protein
MSFLYEESVKYDSPEDGKSEKSGRLICTKKEVRKNSIFRTSGLSDSLTATPPVSTG